MIKIGILIVVFAVAFGQSWPAVNFIKNAKTIMEAFTEQCGALIPFMDAWIEIKVNYKDNIRTNRRSVIQSI